VLSEAPSFDGTPKQRNRQKDFRAKTHFSGTCKRGFVRSPSNSKPIAMYIHKFNQNPSMAEFLLGTDGKILAEASPNDKIWGVGLRQDDPNIKNLYAWPVKTFWGSSLWKSATL
jgi:hypothetical protein